MLSLYPSCKAISRFIQNCAAASTNHPERGFGRVVAKSETIPVGTPSTVMLMSCPPNPLPTDAPDLQGDKPQGLQSGVAVEKLFPAKFAKIKSRQDALQTTFSVFLDTFYPPNFGYVSLRRNIHLD
jgi:hypothetical protein